MKNFLWCVTSAAALLLTNGLVTGQDPHNYVTNGDFEKPPEGNDVSGWVLDGKAVQHKVGGWQRFSAKFNSLDQTRVNFNFGVEHGSIGTIWIDNISSPQLAIANGSFEESQTSDKTPGWNIANGDKTLVVDAQRGSAGSKSIRITHVNEAVPRTAFNQPIDVQPGQDYVIYYDVLIGDDFQGEARGLVFNSTSSSTLVENYTDNLISRLVEIRDRCGQYTVSLEPNEAQPVTLSQIIEVPEGANLQAGIDVNAADFEGTVQLLLQDPSTGNSIRESEAISGGGGWTTLGTPLQTESGNVTVRLTVNGRGTLLVDNAWVEEPRIVPRPQQAEWRSSDDNFSMSEVLEYDVAGAQSDIIAGGLALLEKDLAVLGKAIKQAQSAGDAQLQILISPDHAIPDKGHEAYTLEVTSHGITIKSSDDEGAFYGLMTLLQMIDHHDGQTTVLACNMVDYPDMPMRGVLYGDAEQAARWKMNTLMYSTGMPVNVEDREALRVDIEAARRLNLEFIPYFLTMYAGQHVQRINPNLAAGVWVQDEKVALRGIDPSPLANLNVIRTALTDVVLLSENRRVRYELGRDYTVIDGDMAFPYLNAESPFGIARVEGSRIPDGATVLASYDYVDPTRPPSSGASSSVVYCPLEPEAQQLMTEYVATLAKEYSIKLLNPAHCLEEFFNEEAQLATDSRVIRSKKRPIRLLADDVNVIDAALKAGNPGARIVQWAGHLNGYSREAEPMLPRDAHINVWNYDASWPATGGVQTLEFWSRRNFETSVMSWTNIRNVRSWAQVVRLMREKGYNCTGMINACWTSTPNPAAGMQESAEVSWRIPRKGERQYIEINSR